MATYAELLAETLTLADQTGVEPASDIAEIALVRCMKYIASKVYIPALIPSASYTWQSGDTEASIVDDFGVALTAFINPYLLLVGGTPYVFRDYIEWTQLKAVPNGYRIGVGAPPTRDERPTHVYTIDQSNNILIEPIPKEDDILTLFYRTPPAAYGDGSGTPEIQTDYEHLLVDGAVSWVQNWERNQDEIVPPGKIFKLLDPAIKEMDDNLNSGRQQRKLRLASSYRIPR